MGTGAVRRTVARPGLTTDCSMSPSGHWYEGTVRDPSPEERVGRTSIRYRGVHHRYVCVGTYVYIRMWVCTCVTCMYTYVSVCIGVHVYVCVRVCSNICSIKIK